MLIRKRKAPEAGADEHQPNTKYLKSPKGDWKGGSKGGKRGKGKNDWSRQSWW